MIDVTGAGPGYTYECQATENLVIREGLSYRILDLDTVLKQYNYCPRTDTTRNDLYWINLGLYFEANQNKIRWRSVLLDFTNDCLRREKEISRNTGH